LGIIRKSEQRNSTCSRIVSLWVSGESGQIRPGRVLSFALNKLLWLCGSIHKTKLRNRRESFASDVLKIFHVRRCSLKS